MEGSIHVCIQLKSNNYIFSSFVMNEKQCKWHSNEWINYVIFCDNYQWYMLSSIYLWWWGPVSYVLCSLNRRTVRWVCIVSMPLLFVDISGRNPVFLSNRSSFVTINRVLMRPNQGRLEGYRPESFSWPQERGLITSIGSITIIPLFSFHRWSHIGHIYDDRHRQQWYWYGAQSFSSFHLAGSLGEIMIGMRAGKVIFLYKWNALLNWVR